MARKSGVSAHKPFLAIALLLICVPAYAGISFISRMGLTPTKIDWDFTATGMTLPTMLTDTRASTATYFNSAGLIASAPANTARIDYSVAPNGPYIQKGLLLEPAATNYLIDSEAMDSASAWGGTNATVVANVAVAPDGNTTADEILETTANNVHVWASNIWYPYTPGTVVTASGFIKSAGRNDFTVQLQDPTTWTGPSVGFHIGSGASTDASLTGIQASGTSTLISESITPYPNGWYRWTVTGIVDTEATGSYFNHQVDIQDSAGNMSYTGNSSLGFYIWGMQWENGYYATSYIKTTSAAVTRSADQVTWNSVNWFYSTAGTLFAQFINMYNDNAHTYRVFDLTNTNAAGTFMNNEIDLADTGTTNESDVESSGAVQFSPAGILYSAGGTNRMALSYQNASFAYSINGAAAVTQASGSLPTAAGYGYIGSEPDGNMQGRWIQKIKYFPNKIANTELQYLTNTNGNMIAHVQDKDSKSTTNVDTLTVSGLTAVGSGHFLFAYDENGSGPQAFFESDNGSTSCNWISPNYGYCGQNCEELFYCANDTGAPTSVTMGMPTGEGAASEDVLVAEFSGVNLINPLDVAVPGTTEGTAATSQTTQTVTTTNANDLIIACVTLGGGSPTGGSVVNAGPSAASWTLLTIGYRNLCAYAIVTSTGTYSAKFSWTSGSFGTDSQIAAFRSQ